MAMQRPFKALGFTSIMSIVFRFSSIAVMAYGIVIRVTDII